MNALSNHFSMAS